MFLVFNTGIANYRFPFANWLIFALTISASVWAFAQPEIFWTTLSEDAPWGLRYLLWSPFLHGDWGHLFWNMYFLLVFGNSVAGGLSPMHYLLLYAMLALASSAVSGMALGVFSIGASGAVYGLMGFFLLAFGRAFLRVWVPPLPFLFSFPAAAFIAIYVGHDIYLLSSSGWQAARVDYWAHLGGAACGFFIALRLKLKGEM